eukprot:UN30286
MKRRGVSVKFRVTLIKCWNPADTKVDYFNNESFHTEIGFVVFQLKEAMCNALKKEKKKKGIFAWYTVRNTPSWLILGPQIRASVSLKEEIAIGENDEDNNQIQVDDLPKKLNRAESIKVINENKSRQSVEKTKIQTEEQADAEDLAKNKNPELSDCLLQEDEAGHQKEKLEVKPKVIVIKRPSNATEYTDDFDDNYEDDYSEEMNNKETGESIDLISKDEPKGQERFLERMWI